MKNNLLVCHHFFEDPLKIPFKTHAHDKWEFLFIAKGNPTCMVEGKRYTISENTLIIFKSGQIHRVQTTQAQPYEYISIMCDESLLSSSIVDRINKSAIILRFINSNVTYRRLCKFCEQNQCAIDTLSPAVKSRRICELLDIVLDGLNKGYHPLLVSEDPIVRNAISYIEDNLHSISRLDQICDALGVTKEKLYCHFTQNMLISPMKYVRAKRAALVKAVSLDTDNRVDILKKYGFKNEELFDEAYTSFYRSVP